MGIASFQPPVTTPVKGTSLAEMLGMAQSAQALQQAQQLNPLQLQKAQLELQQAQSVNPLALRKATAETELAEKTLKPSIESKEAEAKRLKLVADQTGVDVTNHYANIARGVYGGLLTDPDFVSGNSKKMEEKLNKAKNFIEDLGIPMHESKIHDNLIQTVKQNPKEAYQLIKNGVQQAGTNAEQFGQVNAPAQYINTGQMQVPIYQSPYQGGGPGNVPAIQNVPAPLSYGQRYEATGRVDQNNNPTALVKDAQGQILGEVTIPAGVNQNQITQPSGAQKGNIQPSNTQPTMNQPLANAPSRLAPYETPETVSAERKRQLDSIQQRQTVKQSQYNYNQILNLADKTLTGVGAETIAKLGGGFAAIPFTTDEATNLNLLGHAIALETGQLAARAGLGTNQGRDLALEQVSKTNWTKEAIKSSARTNRALTTGADLYGLGMENAIKASGNNPLAGRDYTSKWSSVADVNALKYYDAILNKDKQEIKTLVDSVGGPDSKGYKELVNKYQQIYQLVTKGQ